MSNFNTPINAGGLLDTMHESKQTKEDRYIRDRECYLSGKRGEVVSYNLQRDVDMYFMGLQSFNRFGAE